MEGPVKSVKWYKNGKEMDSPKAKDLGNGEYALDIPNADDVDAADYKVGIYIFFVEQVPFQRSKLMCHPFMVALKRNLSHFMNQLTGKSTLNMSLPFFRLFRSSAPNRS